MPGRRQYTDLLETAPSNAQFRDPGGFHHWVYVGEGERDEDECQRCGVVAPDFGGDVISDHGPLPLFCPGVCQYGDAHNFIPAVDEGEIECTYCGTSIGPDTDPAAVNWACAHD